MPKNAMIYQISPDRSLIKFPDIEKAKIYAWVNRLYLDNFGQKQIGPPEIKPVLSVGAVSYPKYGKTNEELLMNVQLNCDQNSYLCRQTKIANYDLHKCNYEFVEYCEDDRKIYTERINMENRIRKAIDEGFKGFEVYYQPQIDAKTGKCVSAEALLRWKDEDGKMVMPKMLIPALESMRLIDRTGMWVMRESLSQCVEWIRKGAPSDFSISVNLSSSQLNDKG
jgi:predicted signal transduction protein with EAL and GGDEF domain